MLQNRKIKEKNSSCSRAFDKPTDSESQTDSNNDADDISINKLMLIKITVLQKDSDQEDGRNVIADTTLGARWGARCHAPPPRC